MGMQGYDNVDRGAEAVGARANEEFCRLAIERAQAIMNVLQADASLPVGGQPDAIVHDGGRVADAVFALLRDKLGDEALFELTYLTAMYDMHATISRALKLETDDRPEPVDELESPEDFDAERYVQVGATEDAKAQFKSLK